MWIRGLLDIEGEKVGEWDGMLEWIEECSGE